jgi:hypothetical protein
MYINNAQPIVLGSGRKISKATVFNALHYGGWIAYGSVSFAWDDPSFGPWSAGLESALWIAWGCGITLVFRSVYRRARAARVSYTSLGLLALALSLLGVPIWYGIHVAALQAWLPRLLQLHGMRSIFAPFASYMASLPLLIPPGNWFPYGCALLTWSSLYFCINAMLDLEIERARVVSALKLADGARLRALQSQLNPHFLFNALNGIATLIRDDDGTTAAEMVDTLSDFLRFTLQKLESPEILVAEELAFIEQYLRIQRFRFGSRLRSSVVADPETHGAFVPTLILQPLVENAVRHGILAREEGGALAVAIRKRGDMLVVSVEDDGPGIGDGTLPFGVGLRNSAERLSALYGDEAHMSVGPRPQGGGFAVVLRLPFRQRPQVYPASTEAAATA